MRNTKKINVRTGVVTLQKEIEMLTSKVDLMKKLSTTIGFFEFYYLNLQKFKTAESCFNYVNSLYKSCFGMKRYEDYSAFKLKIYIA